MPTPPTARATFDALGIDAIVEMILDGHSLRTIAKAADASVGRLVAWIAAEDERSKRIQFARQLAADIYADKAQDALEDAKGTKIEIARARELAQHFRWKASMSNPRRFGTKVELNATVGLHTLSEEELDAQAAALKAQIEAAELARAKAAGVPTQ